MAHHVSPQFTSFDRSPWERNLHNKVVGLCRASTLELSQASNPDPLDPAKELWVIPPK